MFRKEIIYQGGNGSMCREYIETEIKYYVLGILIYSIIKTEDE